MSKIQKEVKVLKNGEKIITVIYNAQTFTRKTKSNYEYAFIEIRENGEADMTLAKNLFNAENAISTRKHLSKNYNGLASRPVNWILTALN
jgi:hypothetical protein